MSVKSIKYVLKYVHKGCDQAMFALQSSQVDKIADYQNAPSCYYVGTLDRPCQLVRVGLEVTL